MQKQEEAGGGGCLRQIRRGRNVCVKQCEAGESLSRKVRQGPYQTGRGRFGRRVYAKQFEAGEGGGLC